MDLQRRPSAGAVALCSRSGEGARVQPYLAASTDEIWPCRRGGRARGGLQRRGVSCRRVLEQRKRKRSWRWEVTRTIYILVCGAIRSSAASTCREKANTPCTAPTRQTLKQSRAAASDPASVCLSVSAGDGDLCRLSCPKWRGSAVWRCRWMPMPTYANAAQWQFSRLRSPRARCRPPNVDLYRCRRSAGASLGRRDRGIERRRRDGDGFSAMRRGDGQTGIGRRGRSWRWCACRRRDGRRRCGCWCR